MTVRGSFGGRFPGRQVHKVVEDSALDSLFSPDLTWNLCEKQFS